MLVDAEPGEFVVEGFGVGVGGEVAVLAAPVGDGAGDAVDELPDAGFAFGGVDFAVEVLADDDVGGELAPGFGDLAVGLFEDDAAAFVLDGGGAPVPGDLVEGVNPLGAEDTGDGHAPLSRCGSGVLRGARALGSRRGLLANRCHGPDPLSILVESNTGEPMRYGHRGLDYPQPWVQQELSVIRLAESERLLRLNVCPNRIEESSKEKTRHLGPAET